MRSTLRSFERLTELTIETKLPVLCKDFIIDKIQIDVAKKAGASIILLIVNILSDTELKELYDYATQLGLEVLVEVHDQDELKKHINFHQKSLASIIEI